MPPRRSVGRNATATPARSTRQTSAVSVEDSATRRTTRAATQQPGTATDADPAPKLGGLREVQLQQSYAYGSRAAIKDLDQLDVSKRATKVKTANEIDAGIDQAKDRLEDHVGQLRDNFEGSPPETRTRRKTSREPSHEPLLPQQPAEIDKGARIAAWANSLSSDQLEEIPEEDEPSANEDDQSRKDTDPSSFPSGIFDATYNFERGARQPKQALKQRKHGPTAAQKASQLFQDVYAVARERALSTYTAIRDLLINLCQAFWKAVLEIPESTTFSFGVKTLVACVCLAAFSMSFCFIFSKLWCDPSTTSVVSQNIQKICGSCDGSQMTPPFQLSGIQQQDVSKISAALQNLQRQISALENRITSRFDSQQASIQSEVETLRTQQVEMSDHLANLQHKPSQSQPVYLASPVLPKVNFFAPSHGAIVDPKQSTPTKAKQFGFAKRLLLRTFQVTNTVSKGPITALSDWRDVGDCWCAAGPAEPSGDFARLHITTQEYVYPTEFVVEHYPVLGTRQPGTAPKIVELWADLSDTASGGMVNNGDTPTKPDNILRPGYVLIGSMSYESTPNLSNVQSRQLDVNRSELSQAARTYVVRVVSTHGADSTCLYRVRLHGIPRDTGASVAREANDFPHG